MKNAIAFVLLTCASVLHAQESSRSIMRVPDEPQAVLTGNVQVDFFGQNVVASAASPFAQTESPNIEGRKSPFLAAGLSLVLPGAGEFYAESYWKAAIFFAADVAFWTLAYTNDKKGDDQTAFFQSFADQHYSVAKYARYALENLVPANRRGDYANLFIPGTENRPPWEQVNWNVLNKMERDLPQLNPEAKYYSHTLPIRPEQQYYELIGKYPQYNQGWNDAPPIYVYSEDNVTANFRYYAGERGKANDYYNTASTFVTVAIINHVISALDAAWSAASYNKRLHASMQFRNIPTSTGYARVPMAKLSYSF